MLRRLTLAFGAASLALSMAATMAVAGNPAGTGQPSVECGDEDATTLAPGFNTAGFAHAEDVYANDDSTGGLASGNWHVVSQYDVACYQITIHH
jgi:ABC-type transport system substrate-binding protein